MTLIAIIAVSKMRSLDTIAPRLPKISLRQPAFGIKRQQCPAPSICLPTSAASVPDRPNWLHEVKYDGYRLRLEREGNRVRLITRGGYNWADRYSRRARTGIGSSSSTAKP